MSTNPEKVFLERGAECVGGDLMLHRKVVGFYRDGSFIVTDAGREELNIEDAVVIEKPARKARNKKLGVEDGAQASDEVSDEIVDVDDLLNE